MSPTRADCIGLIRIVTHRPTIRLRALPLACDLFTGGHPSQYAKFCMSTSARLMTYHVTAGKRSTFVGQVLQSRTGSVCWRIRRRRLGSHGPDTRRRRLAVQRSSSASSAAGRAIDEELTRRPRYRLTSQHLSQIRAQQFLSVGLTKP